MNRIFLSLAALLVATTAMAQNVPQKLAQAQVIHLYNGTAPGSEGWTQKEHAIGTDLDQAVFDVADPTLTVYEPAADKRTGAAMIVCPGGGMCMLSINNEGTRICERLAAEGITAFLLKYRLQDTRDENGKPATTTELAMKALMGQMMKAQAKFAAEHNGAKAATAEWCLEIPGAKYALADGLQALRIVKANAKQWNIDKVGIMGFSAGAIVSLNAAINHTADCAPDFAGIIYGGWLPKFAVPADAAPLFLASPANDIFTPEETIRLYTAWREAQKPTELHYFWNTQHGFGAKQTGASADAWLPMMLSFARDTNFTK